MRGRNRVHAALLFAATIALAWGFARFTRSTPAQWPDPQRATSSPVFTREHDTLLQAVKEFLGYRATPQQPIAFTHKVHLNKGLECVGCHQGVEQGPIAGLPSVKLCMTCHLAIATDKPEIKKVAAFLERGEEIPWQRVYGYYPSAHVRFNHAPHIRSGVTCATCHGDLTKQTAAIRAVDLNMGYCLNCHKQKKVSVDCTTCHF